jgi:hypothetical protein
LSMRRCIDGYCSVQYFVAVDQCLGTDQVLSEVTGFDSSIMYFIGSSSCEARIRRVTVRPLPLHNPPPNRTPLPVYVRPIPPWPQVQTLFGIVVAPASK